MNDLRRGLAPIPAEAWSEIDVEAKRTLETYLAGRKLVDFDGPQGWTLGAVPTGRTRRLDHGAVDGVEARLREVQPLVELRVVVALPREEVDALSRGAPEPDLGPIVDGARRLARAEDRIVFEGYEAAGIAGLAATAQRRFTVAGGDDLPRALSEALEALHEAGVGGPYAVALGPRWYTELAKMPGPDRYPLLDHVRHLIDGPIVWAPSVAGGVLLSTRGHDFHLTVGRDISIGYLDHDATAVRLYFEESLTFRVLTREAAVTLSP
jgi:uncharacterized linocin/CFP29 family protein